jgi:hypothetical protein
MDTDVSVVELEATTRRLADLEQLAWRQATRQRRRAIALLAVALLVVALLLLAGAAGSTANSVRQTAPQPGPAPTPQMPSGAA